MSKLHGRRVEIWAFDLVEDAAYFQVKILLEVLNTFLEILADELILFFGLLAAAVDISQIFGEFVDFTRELF